MAAPRHEQRPEVDPVQGRAPRYPIESVDNALRLLMLFREGREIRLTDASRALGVASSTAHRLLAMLAYHGFVRRDPDRRTYLAGPTLFEIGLGVVASMDLRSIAHPELARLGGLFDETVHLAMLEGTSVRFLDAYESERMLRVGSRTGRHLPAHCTSVGKAMLAALPSATLDGLYPPGVRLPGVTDASISSRRALFVEVKNTIRRGYAVNHDESELGVSSVGVAVLGAAGGPLAALSLAVPSPRMTEDLQARAAEALREAVARIATAHALVPLSSPR